MGGAANGVRGGFGKVGAGERVSVLTVGHTLVLDLQVLVGPRAGVREHVRPCYHHTLGAVVTPARGRHEGKKEGGEGREEVSDTKKMMSAIVRKTKRSGYKKKKKNLRALEDGGNGREGSNFTLD